VCCRGTAGENRFLRLPVNKSRLRAPRQLATMHFNILLKLNS